MSNDEKILRAVEIIKNNIALKDKEISVIEHVLEQKKLIDEFIDLGFTSQDFFTETQHYIAYSAFYNLIAGENK